MARNSVVIDLEVRNRQARAALKGVEGGFTRLSQKSQQSTKAMETGFMRSSQQVQGSTNAVMNLSRIVEDAPFGIRGVANNINPFIESFQNMGDEATTTGQKMKTLLSAAFTGPGALLTISALITSTMTAIQMGLFDWGDEAESVDEQMEALMDTVDEFIEEAAALSGDNTFDPLGQITTEDKLSQIRNLREELDTLFDLRDRAKQLREELGRVSQATAFGTSIPQFGGGDVRSQLNETNRLLDEQERIFGELSQAQASAIDKKIDDLEATQKLNQAFIRLNPVMQQQVTLTRMLDPVLRDVELGLSGADEQLRNLIASYEQTLETLRQEVESANVQGEQLTELKNLMMVYKNAIDQARKALEKLDEQQQQSAGLRAQMSDFRAGARRSAQLQQGVRPQGRGEDTIFGENVFTAMPQSEVDKQIAQGERVIANFEGIGEASEEAGETGEQSMIALQNATDLVGNALAQAIIRGEELEGVLKSLVAQLASRALINGLGMLLGGGAFSFGKLFFGGFASGTDMGFPGAGIVGERGPELAVLPPMSSIITNENLEFMKRQQQEARSGAEAVASMSGGSTEAAMMSALNQWALGGELRAEGSELVVVLRKELRNQGSLGGDGSL